MSWDVLPFSSTDTQQNSLIGKIADRELLLTIDCCHGKKRLLQVWTESRQKISESQNGSGSQ